MAEGLKEKMSSDLVSAMKARDEVSVGTLRLALAAVHNREIEKKSKSGEAELSADEILEVLRREVKKRVEAIEIYKKGNRPELADKESAELAILEKYLPAKLGGEEIAKIVDEAVKAVNPAGPSDFGKVMAEAMKKLKGVADGAMVGELIKKRLNPASGEK